MGNGLFLDVSQDRMQAFNLTQNNFGIRKSSCQEKFQMTCHALLYAPKHYQGIYDLKTLIRV